MSYKTEFNAADYNVPAFLNDKSGWFDESWHNDTCPRFENPKHGLCIWVECTEPSKRQVETDNIYLVQPIAEMSINTVLFSTDSEEQLCAYILAVEFSHTLREWLTNEQMKEVIKLNATEEYADFCASHDYCDANMAMDAGIKTLFGRHADTRGDVELWNAAWTIAKTNNFFTQPKSN